MRGWVSRHPARSLVGLAVVVTGLAEWLADWALEQVAPPASAEGEVVDEAVALLLRLSIPVFVVVALVLVFAVTVFRAREDDPGDSPLQVATDRRAVLGWLAVTTGLTVLVIAEPGLTGLRRLADLAEAPDQLRVDVTARQWGWAFSYPQYGVLDAPELVLPVDRSARLRLRSPDVVHSFWIPAFRIKRDVVPGRTRFLTLTPTRLTSTAADPRSRVQCAELCGLGHAQMQAPMRVVVPAEFRSWVSRP